MNSFVLLGLSIALNTFAATSPPQKQDKPEELTLPQAIAKANKNNPTLYSRRLTLELAELNYQNAWAALYMPSVNLNLNSGSAFTMAQLGSSPAHAFGGATTEHGQPVSGAQLQMGQYTLYNFGKD